MKPKKWKHWNWKVWFLERPPAHRTKHQKFNGHVQAEFWADIQKCKIKILRSLINVGILTKLTISQQKKPFLQKWTSEFVFESKNETRHLYLDAKRKLLAILLFMGAMDVQIAPTEIEADSFSCLTSLVHQCENVLSQSLLYSTSLLSPKSSTLELWLQSCIWRIRSKAFWIFEVHRLYKLLYFSQCYSFSELFARLTGLGLLSWMYYRNFFLCGKFSAQICTINSAEHQKFTDIINYHF